MCVRSDLPDLDNEAESGEMVCSTIFDSITTNQLFVFADLMSDFVVICNIRRVIDVNLTAIFVLELEIVDPRIFSIACTNSSDWSVDRIKIDCFLSLEMYTGCLENW